MDLRRAAPWARAAGATGMAANVLLVAFYAVEAGRRRVLPVSLGSADDVVGSVSTALMVPVVLAVSPSRWTRRSGLAATGVLTLAGPAIVLGLVPFAVQLPIAMGAFELLAAGVVLTGRGRLPVWFWLLGRALSCDADRVGVPAGTSGQPARRAGAVVAYESVLVRPGGEA